MTLHSVSQGPEPLRKTTALQVVNTVTETDLLNGEFMIDGGLMGTNRLLRLTAFGDWIQNTASADIPRLKLKLGATTVIDANNLGASQVIQGATRWGWAVKAEILNLGAANSQWVNYWASFSFNGLSVVGQWNSFATGEGRTSAIASSSSASQHAYSEGGNSTAVDTTVANLLQLTATLSSAATTLDITLRGSLVEIV
jgi:hypothetical protein